MIDSVVINENTEDNGYMCNIDSVEMGPVHLLEDIVYSIEQKVPETKTAKKHFLDNINIEKEEPLQVRNSVNLPYLETPGNMGCKDSVETPEDSPKQILGDAQEDQVKWKNLDDNHTKDISQSEIIVLHESLGILETNTSTDLLERTDSTTNVEKPSAHKTPMVDSHLKTTHGEGNMENKLGRNGSE